MQNSGRQSGNYTKILVAKEKKLVALATVLVAISSPATAFNLSGETEQNLWSDFNHMLLGVFVVVNEAQKLEVQTELHVYDCKAKWNSIHKHEWWYCPYSHHNLRDPTKNTKQPLKQKFQLWICY